MPSERSQTERIQAGVWHRVGTTPPPPGPACYKAAAARSCGVTSHFTDGHTKGGHNVTLTGTSDFAQRPQLKHWSHRTPRLLGIALLCPRLLRPADYKSLSRRNLLTNHPHWGSDLGRNVGTHPSLPSIPPTPRAKELAGWPPAPPLTAGQWSVGAGDLVTPRDSGEGN